MVPKKYDDEIDELTPFRKKNFTKRLKKLSN